MCVCVSVHVFMWTIATFSSMAIFAADTRAASALCFSWATSVRRITRICLNCAAVTFVVGISILNLMERERGRGGAGREKMSGNFRRDVPGMQEWRAGVGTARHGADMGGEEARAFQTTGHFRLPVGWRGFGLEQNHTANRITCIVHQR
jgi:hypothetical protein